MAITSDEPVHSQEKGLRPWQGPKDLGHLPLLSQAYQHELWLEGKHPGLKQVPTWDAGTDIHYATTLAPKQITLRCKNIEMIRNELKKQIIHISGNIYFSHHPDLNIKIFLKNKETIL